MSAACRSPIRWLASGVREPARAAANGPIALFQTAGAEVWPGEPFPTAGGRAARASRSVRSGRCPVVTACTGHALAMDLFLLCSGDYRIGAAGDFKLQANEVASGLTMPYPALAILRYRLTPSSFDRAVGLAEVFTPPKAVEAGLLDRLVDPDAVVPVAQEVAASFLTLDASAHAASKRQARATLLADLQPASRPSSRRSRPPVSPAGTRGPQVRPPKPRFTNHFVAALGPKAGSQVLMARTKPARRPSLR